MTDRDLAAEVLPGHLRAPERLPGTGRTDLQLYRCTDTVRGVHVVAKVGRGAAAESLETEARALSRLAPHPHVLAVSEVGHRRGQGGERVVWLVVEHAGGGSLAQRIGAAAPTARAWAAQLAAALDHAHRHGVVHGDVTPPNVLLDDRDAVLLADFGSAHLVHDADTAGRAAGHFGYTPGLAAPERRRLEPPTPESDVYGLASTILMVCGDHHALGAQDRRLLQSCLGDPGRRPGADLLARRLAG